ncbi:MAG: hypothetical protein DELT_01806 [Desulfovibrio sp.]
MKTIRIGSGAGYSGDRIEPAVELAEKGNIQYLGLECLAERTIAIDQQLRLKDPEQGYDPLMEARWEKLLPVCLKNKVTIITNMGAANPTAALKKTKEIAKRLGLTGFKIAAVYGDDVVNKVKQGNFIIDETGEPVSSMGDTMLSANAYMGAAPIVEALKNGANVIITGRVADPALFMAPLIYEFGWSMDDWHKMGIGTGIGHLLECAGQVTGGYFADPGKKDVPDLARLGFPLVEVAEDGSFIVTKVEGSGGRVDRHTCTEQIIYELHDPSAYLTPDVVADFSKVTFEQEGKDRVKVSGFTGRPKPETLKVSIGYVDSYIGEGQISYAGAGAVNRGRLALDIVKERLRIIGLDILEERYDLIGLNALHGDAISSASGCEPYEVRARVTVRVKSMKEAALVGNEVEALYVTGPAGGAGASKAARQVVAVKSTYVPRDMVTPVIDYEEV